MSIKSTESYFYNNYFLTRYTKYLVNNNEQICGYCKKNNPRWAKYVLPCKHHVHTRCFKKMNHEEYRKLCPTCGNLKVSQADTYCKICDVRGHTTRECSKVNEYNKTIYNANIRYKKIKLVRNNNRLDAECVSCTD